MKNGLFTMTRVCRLLLYVFVLVLSYYVMPVFQSVDFPWWRKTPSETSILDAENFYLKLPVYRPYLENSVIPEEFHHKSFEGLGFLGLLKELSADYDPRMLPALWGNSILQQLEGNSASQITLPFDWRSLVGFKTRTFGVEDHIGKNFCEVAEIEKKRCPFLASPNATIDGETDFIVTGPLEVKMTEKGRQLFGLNYLLHSAPAPERLCFLGVGPSYTALMIPLNPLEALEGALRHLAGKHLKTGRSYIVSVAAIMKEIRHKLAFMGPEDQNALERRGLTIMSPKNVTELSKDDFLLGVSPDMVASACHGSHMAANSTKFFHEATLIDTDQGGHYDWRFFTRVLTSEYEKKAVFHRMARAWLRFAHSASLKTWVAHGTLLGWYWNGMSLPWDNDIDIQMTMESLVTLASDFNQTLVFDVTDDGATQGIGSYLVEVNPEFCSRTNDDGNTIDARFIDTQTGLYVDITALSFSDAVNSVPLDLRGSLELNRLLNPQFLEELESATVTKDDLFKKASDSRKALWQKKDIFNCKDHHFYKFSELSPLKVTLFEGVKAYVPNDFRTILSREYRKGLYNFQYADHTFRPVLDFWVPSGVCKGDSLGSECTDEKTLLEAKHTRVLTAKHRKAMSRREFVESADLGPVRVEHWAVQRLRKVEKVIGDVRRKVVDFCTY